MTVSSFFYAEKAGILSEKDTRKKGKTTSLASSLYAVLLQKSRNFTEIVDRKWFVLSNSELRATVPFKNQKKPILGNVIRTSREEESATQLMGDLYAAVRTNKLKLKAPPRYFFYKTRLICNLNNILINITLLVQKSNRQQRLLLLQFFKSVNERKRQHPNLLQWPNLQRMLWYLLANWPKLLQNENLKRLSVEGYVINFS